VISIDGVLDAGRAAAEDRMTDTCQIGTVSNDKVLNESTLEYENTFTPVYDGPCEFKAGDVQASDVELAGQILVTQLSTLKLPIASSVNVRMGMEVRVTGSQTDPALAGTVARIRAPFVSAYKTARRFAVEVVSGG
jgi:hypothetical protein